jgi:hypothetical protein
MLERFTPHARQAFREVYEHLASTIPRALLDEIAAPLVGEPEERQLAAIAEVVRAFNAQARVDGASEAVADGASIALTHLLSDHVQTLEASGRWAH